MDQLQKQVTNRREQIDKLRMAIQHLHSCGAVYRTSVPVVEAWRGKTVWDGDVDVFDITGNPRARRCYAWIHTDGANDERTCMVVVLEIPPIKNASDAVKASVAVDGKKHEP